MSQEGYHADDEVHVRAYDGRIMARLLRSVRPYRAALALASLLLLLAALLSNVNPYLTMRAIDRYVGNADRLALEKSVESSSERPASIEDRIEALRQHDRLRLGEIALAIGALMLFEVVARYFQTLIVAYAGQKAMLEMRMEVFAHLQRMGLRFLDRNPVGRLMTRVTTDVEKIQQTIVTGLVQVVSDLFTIFVVIGFMLSVNWKLAAITLSTAPLMFAVSAVFRKYARASFLEISRKIARLTSYLQENVSGIRVVQAFRREPRNFEEYRRRNADHRDEWLRQVRYFALYFPAVDFLAQLSIALIILYVGHEMIGDAATLGASVGAFVAYIQWAERLFSPVRGLTDKYSMVQEAMASAERIFQLLDTPEEIQDAPDAVVWEDVEREAIACETPPPVVEFRNVWFAYDDDRWVLKDVSFSIAAGERVAIVGHTGAGKSTIISLLARFHDAQRGQILVNGCDVRRYRQDSLRGNIGMVLQDVFLFSGTVEDNIRLGKASISDADVRRCAEYVNAASFIEALPDGYRHDVGERGCRLSTGQRQLIAFGRALAHRPRVLVLDEATSSVDTATEQLIQDAIGKLMEECTSIAIAHRLSTIQHAHRIIVMHHGEIREMGAHQELIDRRGLYYALHRLQYKDLLGNA